MDARVLEVQQWLNNTFPNYFYYDPDGINSGSFPVEPDGITGHTTVKALVMALQITLNVTPVDGIWGSVTQNACPTISSSTTNHTLIKITQSGLICKGYNPGVLDGWWGTNTANAICSFKTDLGFISPAATLSNSFMKFLLSMDQSVTNSMTNTNIRQVQQFLNSHYSTLFVSALGYIPTGGIYERKTSKALIYALQSCIGTTPDGVLGPNTFSLMPTITSQGPNNSDIVKILQCSLICNNYVVPSLNGIYDSDTITAVTQFQSFMCLNNDGLVTIGEVNRRTWGALLWSRGDTARDYNAIDTSTRLNLEQCTELYQNGIRYVGRYLTKVTGGLDKNMTDNEISYIHSAGLKIVPLFQESNNTENDFTYLSGYESWEKAVRAATKLRIPECVIYFCVDFDVTDVQAKSIIRDFFQGINDAKKVNPSVYAIGIYSSRNVCKTIMGYNLADGCYVSDMSSGYSGNLGYIMPSPWNFDQFYETNVIINNQTLGIDKVIASGNDTGVASFPAIGDDYWNDRNLNVNDISLAVSDADPISLIIPYIISLENAFSVLYPQESDISCLYAVLYYLWHKKYSDFVFESTLPSPEGFITNLESHTEYSNLIDALDVYIDADYTLIKDPLNKLLELPHLAIVIEAYIENDKILTKPEWYGWAGDLISSFGQLKSLKVELGTDYINDLTHARIIIGRMETDADTHDYQFNYCDFFADADAFGIYTLIKKKIDTNNSSVHLLSSAIADYYNQYYVHRAKYFLNNLPINRYDIGKITMDLVDYCSNSSQNILLSHFGNITDLTQENIDVMEACCRSFAEFLMHEFIFS